MAKLKQIYQFYLKKCLFCNLISLSLLFFIHCFWGNMMYIAFPILAFMIIFDSLENGFSYIIFSLPFCFLNVYISVILFLICCLIFILKFYYIYFFKEKHKISWTLVASISLLLIYCIMPIGEYNLNKFLRIFIFLAIFIAITMIIQKREIFKGHFNIKIICFSILLASLFSLTNLFSPYLKDYMVLLPLENNFTRFMALFIHPNVLAMFCEVLLSLLAFFIISKKANRDDIILFIGISLIGLLTFSKTYIIILCIQLMILLVWCFIQNAKKTSMILIPLLSLALLICIFAPNVISNFTDRFIGNLNQCHSLKDILNMITTGRYDLWRQYSQYILNNPLVLFFGRGLGAPQINLLSPHNGYIAIIYQMGLVGTILFIQTLYFIFREYFKTKPQKPHWAISLPIITLALIFMVEDLIFYIFD